MSVKKLGPIYQYGRKTFCVGGMASFFSVPSRGQCGIIKELWLDCALHPVALCDFGEQDMREVSLEELEPMDLGTPVETGQLYALYYMCDGEDGQWAKVIGISSSKNVLLQLMLEDVKSDPQVELTSAHINKEDDVIYFEYENAELLDALYISYSIAPVLVYSKAEGGTTV